MSLTRARLLTQEAAAAAQEPYTLALAATVEGIDATTHWADFRRILERAYVLIGLEAAADAYGAARRSGVRSFEAFDRETDEPDEVFSIEAGPFMDAVRAFESRVPRLPDEVRRLLAESGHIGNGVVEAEMNGAIRAALSRTELADRILHGSFWVTGATADELIDLRSVLAGVMRGELDGEALRQMGVSDFVTAAQARGIRNLTANRLETIYRNNLSGSYAEAAARTLERDDVHDVMPLVMLNEIRDRRTRGNPSGLYPNGGFHWQMDGFVGTMVQFRELGIIPPNGHLCRAGIRGVTSGEALANGWVDERGQIDRLAIANHNGARLAIIQRGQYPDPGFRGA